MGRFNDLVVRVDEGEWAPSWLRRLGTSQSAQRAGRKSSAMGAGIALLAIGGVQLVLRLAFPDHLGASSAVLAFQGVFALAGVLLIAGSVVSERRR